MHSFLDTLGIFQINVKQQLEDEKKTIYSASPNIHKFTAMRAKQSSFMERRMRNISKTAATAASSSGAQSVTHSTINRPASLIMGGATFSSEIFRGNRPTAIGSSFPKSVEEEPNSGNSNEE